MVDPEIAPLAQRLAEENNVDWRTLRGTGTDGRIVERDVLAYLARVMAGEEDVDPTPEPLPEGLEAWPEEDPSPSRPEAGSAGPEEAVPATQAERDDALLLAGDDLAEGPAQDDGLLVGDGEAPDDAAAAERRFDDGPALFDDEAYGADAGGDDADPPAPDDDREGAPDLFDGDLRWEDEAPAAAEPDFEVGMPPQDDGRSEGDAGFDFGGFPGEDVAAPADAGPEPDRDAGGVEGSLDDEAPVAPAGVGGPTEAGQGIALDEADAEGPAVAPAASGAIETAASALPLARTPQVLRRHVSLGAAFSAQRAVVQEGGTEGTAVAALLAAAVHHAGAPFGAGRVAVARFTDGGALEAVAVAPQGLAAISRGLADDPAADDPDGVDLWLSDLSALDLDDVVLDVSAPQLTLGRVLRDGDDGTAYATLALSGDVDTREGASFLARVAERIEDPLRLLT